MSPKSLVLLFFLVEFSLWWSDALALPACPGERFYLKTGEALEIEFNRKPGCDVKFMTVERGMVERRLFYPSGKSDNRVLKTGQQDIPEAWTELPQKAFLRASAETVVRFLAVRPVQSPRQNQQPQTRSGPPPINVEIRNTTNETITHYWIDPAGREIKYGDIAPRSTVTLNTYEQHVWRIKRTSTNETIAQFAATRKMPRVMISSLVSLQKKEQLSTQRNRPSPPPPQVRAPPVNPFAKPPPRAQSGPPWLWPQGKTAMSSTIQQFLGQVIGIIVIGGFFLLFMCLVKSSSVFIRGHWSKLIENLQASPKEFYASVEEAIKGRQVPAITNTRVDWKEGGLFTARREYLRISREKEVVDICAAPYGTGFFVSWWHAELLPSAIGPIIAVIVIFVFVHGILSFIFGATGSLFLTPITAFLMFLITGVLINRSAGENWVRYVLAIPIIGWLMDRLFLPPTYYRLDSASMFEAAIDQSVKDVIDQLTQAKGLRALTELERKPILRDFFQNLR